MNCFPDLYPDELLYGGATRYHWRLGGISHPVTILELTGEHKRLFSVDLPHNLLRLAQSFPQGSSYSVQRLIYDHTLWPYYGFFESVEKRDRMQRALESDSGAEIYRLIGMTMYYRLLPKFLRYCPTCTEEDRSEYREAYWHRLHQIPGNVVCVKHRVFLENSSIRMQTPHPSCRLITAEQTIRPSSPRRLNEANMTDQGLLRLAQDIEWIMSHWQEPCHLTRLHRIYWLAWREIGFGQSDLTFAHLLSTRIPKDLLQAVNAEWIKRRTFARLGRCAGLSSLHPLLHLVWIQILGSSVSTAVRSDCVLPMSLLRKTA